jgi:hypothetical protein
MKYDLLILLCILLLVTLFGCTGDSEYNGLDSFEIECEDCGNVLHVSKEYSGNEKIYRCDDSSRTLKGDTYCPVCAYNAGRRDAIEEVQSMFTDGLAVDSEYLVYAIQDYFDDDIEDEIVDGILENVKIVDLYSLQVD